jgi:nuclear transcription Y subunit beta
MPEMLEDVDLTVEIYFYSRIPRYLRLKSVFFLYFFYSFQDRYLPIANISRIMKNQLPENAKIAKESKEAVQETVSEFISFITSEASDKCMQEKRKTINGDDLLWAMSTLGFDKYVEPLKIYLNKYREAVRGDKPIKGEGGGQQSYLAPGAVGGGATVGRPPARASMAGEGVGVPPNKKSKVAKEGGGA